MHTTDGINQERQQLINRALVIDLLRQEGICSRATIAKQLKLKQATITNIVSDFISCGLVVETGILSGQKNRRSIGIRINGKSFRIIGVMLTRKHFYTLSLGLSGEIYETKRYPIKENADGYGIIEDITSIVQSMINKSDKHEVLAVGVAMPGPYDHKKGELVFLVNLSDWENIPIHEEFQKALSVPVFIENDANAGAYAQMWCRKKNSELLNLVYIMAGQGIGCGVITKGSILRGEAGLASEIGHTSINVEGNKCECGNRGCLETYCSTLALEKRLRERIQNGEKTILREDFTWEDIVRAIREKDELALMEYRAVCGYLAVGVVNIIYQTNPGIVVIGDQLAEVQPELMLEIVDRRIRKTIRPIIWRELKIELNTLKVNPALIGAGAIAIQEIFKDPYKYVKLHKD